MDALKLVGVSLVLASTASLAEAGQDESLLAVRAAEKTVTSPTSNARNAALSASSRLSELLNHPAFDGFSRLLLPWDDRSYDGEMRLSDIGTLLPYHSQVVPDVVVGALNRMIGDVNTGQRIFFDFYTEAQKQVDPSKRPTGLFFLRGKPGAPFAVIAPGGGFSYVGSVHEGFPYAVEINAQGYNAFVLKYRVGHGGGAATQDLAAALTYILDNAAALGVGRQNYSVWGSSAGARMAASIGSHGVAAFGGKPLPKPATVVMAYTGHSDYSSNEPPTFIVVGDHDGIAPPSVMKRRADTLKRAGTAVEYRQYSNVGHGFGPGTGTSAEGWVTDATRFWEGFIAVDHRVLQGRK